MIERNRKYRIFISVSEPSADAHCAGLVQALRRQAGDGFEFVGVGGPRMAEAGCELLEATVGKAVMIYNAFASVGHFYKLIRRIADYLREHRPDLVVVCDSPGFNWHIAKAARKLGIPTLFYVAPQLWAWASWRIRKLKRTCDKLCCILPFEQEWFTRRGVDTTYVGHPMVDRLDIDWGHVRTYEPFDPAGARIALMPGSRKAENETLWRPMQQIALGLKRRYPGAGFTTVAVDAAGRDTLRQAHIDGFECDYTVGGVHEAAKAADFAIVASGSATLEVAAATCPMVIMYQSSRLLWHLAGKYIIKTRYLSLVNILAGRELVPEFMPYFTSVNPIIEAVVQRLEDPSELARISAALKELVRPLAARKAGDETAGVVLELLGSARG